MFFKSRNMILFPLIFLLLFLTACDMLEQEVINEEWVINIHRTDNFGGTKVDVLYDIIETADDNFVAVGQSISDDGDVPDNNGQYDVWVIKTSKTGTILWSFNYGGSDYDIGKTIIQTTDGGYVVAGYTKSTDEDVNSNHGDYDLWIFKLDANGALKWENAFGGTDTELLPDLCKTNDGGFIVVGRTKSTDGDVTGFQGIEDGWIVKVNGIGEFVWQKTLGGTQTDRVRSVCSTHDNGFLVVGSSKSSDGDVSDNNGQSDVWLCKLDNLGNILWDKNYGGSNNDYAFSVARTTDNGFIVAGRTDSTDQDVSGNHGYSDGWVLKVDINGDLDWAKCYGGTLDDEINSVIQISTGEYAFLGSTKSADGDVPGNKGDRDFLFMLLDEDGNIEWSKNYGGSATDIGSALVETSDGNYVLCGNTYSNDGDVLGNNGNNDGWVLQLRRQ